VKGAIFNAGYKVSGFHKDPEALKTDAPSQVVWDVLRAWAKENPPKKALPDDSAGSKIMAVTPAIDVDFTVPESMQHKSKESSSVSRFPLNPERNWGPKRKASNNNKRSAAEEERAAENTSCQSDSEPPNKKSATLSSPKNKT
jgi:tRNA (guanine26-N2/guanine27-N2)-dimethyltransferase